MAANWSPARRAVRSEPFPLLRSVVRNGPEPVKGAPLLGAAKRTLDGEDRSEMIAQEGKAGRTIGERWSAILVPSPAASNTPPRNDGLAANHGDDARSRPSPNLGGQLRSANPAQAPESGGQPGHHGILGGPSFEPLEDRVEDRPDTRTLESTRYFHNAFGARLLKLVDE